VLLLTRHHGVPTAVAISSVFIDKLIEIISNFAFLILGLLVISAAGSAPGSVPGWVLPLLITILLGMTAHLALLWQGKTPFTWLALYLSKKVSNQRQVQTIFLALQQAENEMMTLCRSQPRFLFEAMGVSLLIWLGLLWEYQIMARFVGLSLDLSQVILALTLARLAFLVPLPGGLGALEASQVLAMQLLGFSPAFGISLCLIIRARDLVIGGAGLSAWGLVARL
jgi:uncharacterized membrane protein YbhN (UPF0104 family)